MSMKGKARIKAAVALKDIAKVKKFQGQLHVLRTTTTGRTREWQRLVIKTLESAAGNLKVAKISGKLIVMEIRP